MINQHTVPETRVEIDLRNFSIKQPELIREHQLKKFSDFETFVILPIATKLRQLDPDSAVLISGSYKSNPTKVRPGSDFDLIVFSEALKDPKNYLTFLNSLRLSSVRFCNGNKVVFFTQCITESLFQILAAKEHGDPLKVIPCHFLYYKNAQEFFNREPERLGTRLLHTAHSILPIREELLQPKVAQPTTPLEKLLWDCERYTAELVLNRRFLKQNDLTLYFSTGLYQSVRFFGDYLSGQQNVEGVLKRLGGETLWESFQTLINARDMHPSSLRDLLKPTIELIKACQKMIKDNG